MSGVPADVTTPAPGPLTASEVILGGSARQWRATRGVSGPADVPPWMTGGGAAVRAGAAALAADAGVVRRVRDAVRSVLGDAGTSLGWQGAGARSAEGRAAVVHGSLTAVADRLDTAHGALLGLAAALDAQHPRLAGVSASWARSSGPAERETLLRQLRPAVEALDVADARAADVLRQAAADLVRLRDGAGGDGWIGDAGGRRPADGREDGDDAPDGGGLLGTGLGEGWRAAVDTAASVANAMGHHLGASAELAAGLLLVGAGSSGELAGVALDATGAGAVAGVPVGAASAGLITAGAGLATLGGSTIWLNATGDDHVAPAGSGSPVPRIDIQNANYAQRTASRTFSEEGAFSGKTVDDIVQELRSGRMTPEDVPIDAINRDGHSLILNTRSSLALQEAGIPRSQWHVVNRTGQPGYEGRLTDQLARNRLDVTGASSVRISGGR